ncbi:hypothetical protein E2I00_018320, partial [Balaenoptera physalus]
FTVRLSGSGSRCQGHLEVNYKDKWYTVHSQSWGLRPFHREDPGQAWKLCQKLRCREPLLLSHIRHFKGKRPQSQITCRGQLGSFSNCSDSKANQGDPLSLICLAPPRLQLVARPGGLRCAGLVEFYSGSLGGTPLPETEAARTLDPGESGPLPIRWKIQNRRCASVEQCFRKVQPQEGGQALGLICSERMPEEGKGRKEGSLTRYPDPREPGPARAPTLPVSWGPSGQACSLGAQGAPAEPATSPPIALPPDFQPKVQSRLVGGSSTCEGSVEVRQGKQWDALCDSSSAKGVARWEDVCQEQQCGNVSSYQLLDTGEKTSGGFFCPPGKLSQCHQLLQKKSHCKRVFVTCQNSSPAGLAAGTVTSIILALVLAVVLLVVCGPLAYKKLVKKFRQKKQRQWIGPTGMNQNMSFHRNHTVTVRSQAENPTASHLENEYSQPPRNSQISAFPALEGALHRVSAQPDNSSDSDYDLHGAQRL